MMGVPRLFAVHWQREWKRKENWIPKRGLVRDVSPSMDVTCLSRWFQGVSRSYMSSFTIENSFTDCEQHSESGTARGEFIRLVNKPAVVEKESVPVCRFHLPLIVGGESVSPGEFPHMVCNIKTDNSRGSKECKEYSYYRQQLDGRDKVNRSNGCAVDP